MSETLDLLRSAVAANDEIAEALGGIDKLLAQLGFNLNAPNNRDWLSNAMRNGPTVAAVKIDGLAAALRAGGDLSVLVDEDALEHVAEQRAMRMVLFTRGRSLPTTRAPISFSADDLQLIEHLKDAWVSGFQDGQRLITPKQGPTRHRYMS